MDRKIVYVSLGRKRSEGSRNKICILFNSLKIKCFFFSSIFISEKNWALSELMAQNLIQNETTSSCNF